MKIIYDSGKYENKIKKSFRKFCYSAEHNYINYFAFENPKTRNVVFDFGKGRLILANVDNKNRWELFPSGILALENERFSLLTKFLNYALVKKRSEKVVVEVNEDLRKEILKKFKINKKFMARIPLILYWPVYNMSKWDPKLKGKKWKKLRNIKNRFYRRYRVRAVESKNVGKEKLKQILYTWLKRRNNNDHVDKDYYINMINSRFKGFQYARTLLINGNPSTITGGWKIPNSDSYYSSIGIFDYSYKDLGDITNMDDLNNLKKHGFKFVDFGGSDKSLLAFKKKFKPENIYKTYIFSIVRNGIKH